MSGTAATHSRTATFIRRFIAIATLGFTLIGGIGLAGAPPASAARDAAAVTATTTLNALKSGDKAAYSKGLSTLAGELAPRANVSAEALVAAWTKAEPRRMVVMLSAVTQLGVRYGYARAVPGKAFDCSGLVSWAWAQAGVSVPRQSRSAIRATTLKAAAQVLPGDVMWYPGHVMISLGVGDAMVHAAGRSKGVEVKPVYNAKRRALKVGSPI